MMFKKIIFPQAKPSASGTFRPRIFLRVFLSVFIMNLCLLINMERAHANQTAQPEEQSQPWQTLEEDVQSAHFEIREDGVYCNAKPVAGGWFTPWEWAADPQTFEVLDERSGYGRDKDYVYFRDTRVEGADSASFRVLAYLMGPFHGDERISNLLRPMHGKFIIQHLWSAYARDKNAVYYNGLPLRGADPDTFEILHGHSGYARDKDNVFFHDFMLDLADRDSFEVLGGAFADFSLLVFSYNPSDLDIKTSSWAQDKYQLFRNEKQLPHISPRSYKIEKFGNAESFLRVAFGRPEASDLTDILSEDLRQKIEKEGLESWEYLGQGWSRDKKTVYYMGRPVEALNPDYFRMLPEDNRYATDGQYVFYGKKRVIKADPQTFHLVGDSGFLADSRYVWAQEGLPLPEASPDNFKLYYVENWGVNDYARYASSGYRSIYPHEEEKVLKDWNTLRRISPHTEYMRDDKQVYYRGYLVEAEADTFIPLGKGSLRHGSIAEFASDGKHVFLRTTKLREPGTKRPYRTYTTFPGEEEAFIEAKDFQRIGNFASNYFRYKDEILYNTTDSQVGLIKVAESSEDFLLVPRQNGPQYGDLAIRGERIFVNGTAKGRGKGALIPVPKVPGSETRYDGNFWLLTEGRALFKSVSESGLISIEVDGCAFRLLPGYVYATDGKKILCKGAEVENVDVADFVPLQLLPRMASAIGYDTKNIYAFTHAIAPVHGKLAQLWPAPRHYGKSVILNDEKNLYLLSATDYGRAIRLHVLPLLAGAQPKVLGYLDSEDVSADKSVFFTDGKIVYWGDTPLQRIDPRGTWKKVHTQQDSLIITPKGVLHGKYGHLHAESVDGQKVPFAPDGLMTEELSENDERYMAFDGRFYLEIVRDFMYIWEENGKKNDKKWRPATGPLNGARKLKLVGVYAEGE